MIRLMRTPMLDHIKEIDDVRRLSEADLPQLANELRMATISAVSKTGGHLGAGLGVVELTVALHYVFSTPEDRLIWDVGHQAYPHKILTGRRDRIESLRQKVGYRVLPSEVNQPLILLVLVIPHINLGGLGMAVASEMQAFRAM